MNQHIQTIIDLIQQSIELSDANKAALEKAANDADKALQTATETNTRLLKQTLLELEQKRKIAETLSRELEIESSLERVRAVAIKMKTSNDLLNICEVFFNELQKLGFNEVRNALIHTFVDEQQFFNDYDYSDFTGGCISRIPYFGHPVIEDFIKHIRSASDAFTEHVVSGKELADWKEFRKMNGEADAPRLDTIPALYYYNYSVGDAGIGISSFNSISAEKKEVLKRFRNVFDFAYRRYLDVAKAEAQVRESQIELGLERVRAKTMAMHKSDELKDVVRSIYDQFKDLKIEFYTAIIFVFLKDSKDTFWWLINEKNQEHSSILVKYADISYFRDLFEAKEKGLDIFSASYSGEKKREFYNYLLEHTDFKYISEEQKQFLQECEFVSVSTALTSQTAIHLTRYSNCQFSEDEKEILKRFARVFDQAYTRFNDLEKAEAQAREAEIELALERVRSRAMAMHSSKELKDVATELRNQMSILGQADMEICAIHLYDESPDYFESIAAGPVFDPALKVIQVQVQLPKHGIQIIEEMMNQYHSGKKDYVLVNQGEKGIEWFELLKEKVPVAYEFVIQNLNGKQLEEITYYWSVADFKGGALVMTTYVHPDDEARRILRRFSNVFGLAYQRFKDLKKAEEQAKEAQVEAALERVRGKAMAMQTSEDVTLVTETMFDELKKLGIENLRCGIANIHQNRTFDVFGVTNLPGDNKMSGFGLFGMDEHPVWQRWFESWKNKEEVFVAHLKGKEKEEYVANINNHRNYLPQKIIDFPDNFFHAYFFEQGAVWTYSLRQHNVPERNIMQRFAMGFSLTFRRYQDLKKAEAQTKEAKIEAALERVRGKAMAMHNSQDLAATIGTFYRELETFSITPRRCGVGLLNKETRLAELSTMNTTEQGDTIEIIGTLKMEGHPVLNGVYENWLLQKEYHPVLRGNEIEEYYHLLRPQIAFPDYPHDAVQYGYFFFFNEGGVYAWTEKQMNEEELQIYRRFTTVLSLTYKRYMDLKQAEANAMEAVKQAALDRIRADIASMRTVSDLDRITPLIWNELNILGIPFIRCGVFIMDEKQQLIHTFLSAPDGKAIAAFHLPYHTSTHIDRVLRHWQQKEIYLDHWGEEAFIDLAHLLVDQGAISSPDQYLHAIPKGGFHLHFLPFLQGMLYVGNTTELDSETIKLLQSVADTFSTAYARYEDFNKLEVAKRKMEKTLTDLKQAQQQLIQSEKMASLGELTAGIAHEIQNPLNFVNNFSDVSNELLEEMKVELSKGNVSDAIAISEDVKQNLEKILHHGKRADAIVKGMLLHSRSSSGQKEPTDINALADEYLRLAYHGLRAKDKSFNAKFETSFDPTLERINVVPQEIGRVILNLINNAFHAVREKKKWVREGFEPTVVVGTKQLNDGIEISIKDNGNGIPDSIKEKVFQPFFTTKPTGQGTGLGLSICYDIVKANGGQIRFESKTQVGTEFILVLPV